MKISNIFLVICLIFIVVVFFVSPKIIEKRTPESLPAGRDFFIGKIIKEPDQRSNHVKLTLQTEIGKILITTSKYPEYNYGDILKISGNFQSCLKNLIISNIWLKIKFTM